MKILLIATILLLGCGNHTKVEFHETTQEHINSMANHEALAWTTWEDKGYAVYCDIYLLPISAYKTSPCYDAVIKHELRHCYEFNFHIGRYYLMDCH